MERRHRKLVLAAGLAIGAGSCLMGGAVQAAPAGAVNELTKPDAAQQELWAQERSIAQRAQQQAQTGKVNYQSVPVSELVVNGYKGMGEKELKSLVPEATKSTVNVEQLAKQIQLANASGAMHLSANFRHARGGRRIYPDTERRAA